MLVLLIVLANRGKDVLYVGEFLYGLTGDYWVWKR